MGETAWEPEAVMPVLLAHQGGWDEILLVLVPIALFALLLVIANRRANAIESGRRQGGADASESGRRQPGAGSTDRGRRQGGTDDRRPTPEPPPADPRA